jgi:hypothetical protein
MLSGRSSEARFGLDRSEQITHVDVAVELICSSLVSAGRRRSVVFPCFDQRPSRLTAATSRPIIGHLFSSIDARHHHLALPRLAKTRRRRHGRGVQS